MNMYDMKSEFAHQLGYKTVGAAIAKLSANEFNNLFAEKTKEKKEVPIFSKNCTSSRSIILYDINPNYRLYLNGQLFSSFYDKVLKPYKLKPKKEKGTPHYTYYLKQQDGSYKGYQIARLVKFYFGEHNYKRIEDMPKLMFLDGDTTNFDLENIPFDLNHTVIKEAAKTRTIDYNSKIKAIQIPIIKEHLKTKTYAQIGRIYNVSDMSVSRFVRRHNLKSN